MIRVAAVTGPGVSALHGILISGNGTREWLNTLLSRTSIHDCWHADILDGQGEPIDDAVCLRWVRSEEAYLLTTHGNRLILDQVVERCVELGAIHQTSAIHLFDEPSEMVPNRIRREALDLLPEAVSSEVCAFLLSQSAASGFAGEVASWIHSPPSLERVEQLLANAGRGLQMVRPPRVVLTGVTNAGKSTLFNRLVGEDRSIVTAVEGTTRDLVTSPAQILGWPLQLVDGAGSRETVDQVEAEGLRRLAEEVKSADLILELLLPGQNPQDSHDPDRTIHLYSRCDEWDPSQTPRKEGSLSVSAVTGEGIADLEAQILRKLHGENEFDPQEPCPFLAEHVIFLEDLRQRLSSDSGVGEQVSGFLEGATGCHP